MIAALMGGNLAFLSLVIFDREAAVLRTAYQNKYCSPGLGAGASTSEKTTRFPERKTGGFVSLVPACLTCPLTI